MADVERIYSCVDSTDSAYGHEYKLEAVSQIAADGTPWLLVAAGKTASVEFLDFVGMGFDDVVDFRNALNDWITVNTEEGE